MNVSTKDSREKSLEKISTGKPISVYSINFAKVINKFPGKRFIPGQKNGKLAAQRSFSRKVFSWRNAAAVTAILAIGVLHFAFQMSIVRNELSENRPVVEVPPVKIEPLGAAPIEAESTEIETGKTDAAPSKLARAIKQRQPEPAPFKPQLKKKEAVETRAARLRRAERLLTGV
jgi:hypothetical protein